LNFADKWGKGTRGRGFRGWHRARMKGGARSRLTLAKADKKNIMHTPRGTKQKVPGFGRKKR